MRNLTTHILDTSIGKPAEGITIILYRGGNDQWEELSRIKTNADGRAPDLVNQKLEPTIYKLRFETKDYFDKKKDQNFLSLCRNHF